MSASNFTPPPKPTKPPQIKPAKNKPESSWAGKKTWKKTEINEIPKYTDSDLRDLAEFLSVMILSAIEDMQAEQNGSENKPRDYKKEISSRVASIMRNQKQGGSNE